MKKIISAFLAIVLMFSVTSSLYAADENNSSDMALPDAKIYVAPDGDDSADGSIENPLATFAAAKEKAKELGGNLTVYFRGGEYFIKDTVVFDETDAENVVYAAYPGETPVFSGSKPVTGWSETTVNGVTAWVADYPYENNTIAFYKGDKALSTPRYPAEENLLTVTDPVYVSSSYGTLPINPDDIPEFSKMDDVFVGLYPANWDEYIFPIARLDREAGELDVFGSVSSYDTNTRYYFDNVFEALDAPGECYLDTAERKVYYIPQTGDVIDGFTLNAGITKFFIEAKNADGISFNGLSFTETLNEIIPYKYEQGGRRLPNLITFTDCDNIVFDSCVFFKIGLPAMAYLGECDKCTVNNCEFYEIAGNVLKLDQTDAGVVPSDFTLTNNLVKGYGQFYHLCDGIMIGRCHRALIDRNTVSEGYYTTFSIGRTWEHADNWTDNIIITHNHIFNIGTGIVNDMGAIYLLGEQPGTVVAYNLIHDLTDSCGIYPDQGNSYVRINHNFLYNIDGAGITMTGSSDDMVVENNIVLFSNCLLNGGVNFYGSWLPTAPIFRNNILLAEDIDDEFFGWGLRSSDMEDIWPFEQYNNYFFRYSGEYEKNFPFFDGMYYDEDPLFRDPLNGDFTLSEDSPLYDLENFELWDFFDAGRPE